MVFKKLLLIGFVLIVAGLVIRFQRQHLSELKSEIARLRLSTEQTRKDVAIARVELERSKMQQLEAQAAFDGFEHTLSTRSNQQFSVDSGMQTEASSSNENAAGSYVSLSKTNLHRFHLKPVTEEFHLADEAVAILGMTDLERSAVDQAIEQLITRHNQLDLSKAEQIEAHLSAEPGRKTSFRVPAYPAEGQQLADEFVQSTQEAIGSKRTELLLGFADLSTLSAEGFEPFGRTEKTITFVDRITEDGERGDCQIVMKVVDLKSGFSLLTSFPNTDEKIPLNWRHLIQNLNPSR